MAELEERRRLHELEVRLAEAQMDEELGRKEVDPGMRSNQGDEYTEGLYRLEEPLDHPLAVQNNNRTLRVNTAEPTALVSQCTSNTVAARRSK